MPSLNEVFQELPKGEVEEMTIKLLQALMEQRGEFNLEQDVVFSSGYHCKPLHLFLSEVDPERISPILALLHESFDNTKLSFAVSNFRDSDGKTCSGYAPGLAYNLLKTSLAKVTTSISPFPTEVTTSASPGRRGGM